MHFQFYNAISVWYVIRTSGETTLVLSPSIFPMSKIRLLTSRELPRLVLPPIHSRSGTGHLHLSGGYLGDAGRAAGNTHGGDAFLHGGGGALGKVFLGHPIWCAAPRAGHAWVHVSPAHYQRTHHQKAGQILQVCSLNPRVCVPYHVTVSFPASFGGFVFHTIWQWQSHSQGPPLQFVFHSM